MSKEKSSHKLSCGLIMPISSIDGCPEDHWAEVRNIITESLVDLGLDIKIVSEADDTGVIQKRIVQNIYESDIVICDVSAKNPNVMFELGMRLAFDKPAIIIKDRQTPFSFDISPVEHIEYPRDLHYPSMQSFKKKLADKVAATIAASKSPSYTSFLKNFSITEVAKIERREVDSYEFLIQSISDLRVDVSKTRSMLNHMAKALNNTHDGQDILNDEDGDNFDEDEIVTSALNNFLKKNPFGSIHSGDVSSFMSSDEVNDLVSTFGIPRSKFGVAFLRRSLASLK